jgi:hypothetical protein
MGRSTTNWIPLSLPPDVVARVRSCIKGSDGASEIFRLLKGSGIAPTCCNDLDKIIKRYAGGPQGRIAYYYYQCACGSDEPFKLRIATKRGGKVDVAYQGRHRSEVPCLSVEENGHIGAATMAAVAPAAVAGITTARGDPAQQHPKRQRLEEEEKKQEVESQGSGSDQEPTATTEAGVVAPGVHRVEPTRIPYRPDNEGIVRGKLHQLVASKNCEYYTKPFTVKKGTLERDVWRGQEDEVGGSDDCCMTFREIREGVAEAFREAQALGDELVNHYPHVDCTRIGGNRVEYFLST